MDASTQAFLLKHIDHLQTDKKPGVCPKLGEVGHAHPWNSRNCNDCRAVECYENRSSMDTLVSDVASTLLASSTSTTICTAKQEYSVAGGQREEQAALVQIDCFKPGSHQNGNVAKHSGPLRVLVSFIEASTRTSDGVTQTSGGEDVSSVTVIESAVHVHLISEETPASADGTPAKKEGLQQCKPLLALRLLGGEELHQQQSLCYINDRTLQSFRRQLATAGLCKSFTQGWQATYFSRFHRGPEVELKRQWPFCALVLLARAQIDPSFLGDGVAVANYSALVARFAAAAQRMNALRLPAPAKSLAPGMQLLLWSQGRKCEPPASAGTAELVRALARAGVQTEAPPHTLSLAARAELAKVSKAVAAVAREGEEEGVAFLGGSFSLPEEIFSLVLSLLAPSSTDALARRRQAYRDDAKDDEDDEDDKDDLIRTVPLVAKAWLAVSHEPSLHKALRIPDPLSMTAALNLLRQPRFVRVEQLTLGKTCKIGATGAASLKKLCPHLRDLDLCATAPSRTECDLLLTALPQLAGLSFKFDSAQHNALSKRTNIGGAPPNAVVTSSHDLCNAITGFAHLRRLRVVDDLCRTSARSGLGDYLLTQLSNHCPKLESLAVTASWLETTSWMESSFGRTYIRQQAHEQRLTDRGVSSLLRGCPQLQSLSLSPTCFIDGGFQSISDQLRATPPRLKLKHLVVTDNPALSDPFSGAALCQALAESLETFSYDDFDERERRRKEAQKKRAEQQAKKQKQWQEEVKQRREAREEEKARPVREANDAAWSRFGFVNAKPSASAS